MSRLKTVRWAAFLVSVLGASSVAQAQWLPDRNYTEGPGIRLGDVEFHPGVAVRGGYDSNIFRTEKNRVGSAILAVTPHLNFRTLSKQRATQGEEAAGATKGSTLEPPIAFNLGASGTFFKYFDNRGPSNMEVDTSGALSVLPERPFGFDVGLSYARLIRPFSAYAGFDRNNLYAMNRVRPSLNFRAQSRSGVLRASLGYAPTVELFENRTFQYLNNTMHEVLANAAWRFLPYTAFVYDGSVAFSKYSDYDSDRAVIRLSPTSTRYQSRLGINGAITPHLGARALVGYAVGTFEDRALNEFEDVVGEAALNYAWEQNSVELGFQRVVQPAALSGWMLQNRGYLALNTLVARVFAINVNAGLGNASYGRLLSPNGTDLGVDKNTNAPTDRREDFRYDAGLHLEYRATNWLAILGDVSMFGTNTDFRFNVANGQPFPAQFVAYQAFGGVRAHY